MKQTRIQDPTVLDEVFIKQSLENDENVIVQFSNNIYNDGVLEHLNELCLRYDENFSVRFYGHYGKSFDCKTVEKIPNVKSLDVDCLTKADNTDSIAKLKYLQKLSIGIFELKDMEILSADNFKGINELFISETKSKALNLEYLHDYTNLSRLYVSGHTKNIDAIGDLKKLKLLNLRSISKVPLIFINQLKNLVSLRIILGGRENIHEIVDNDIESLEIIWVRGFNDLSNIGRFRKLKTLFVEDQIKLTQINFQESLPELNYLRILNCKTLTTLRGLEKLPKLDHLRIYRTSLDFESLIKQPLPASLKTFAFYTTSEKTDKIFKDKLEKLGYSDGLSVG